MPQVDLETLVCGGGGSSDRKIACETLIDDNNQQPPEKNSDLHEEDIPPDFPAESFWLSREDEFDWFDRNAFYERKESTKGNSNSDSKGNSISNSNSQRFSLNLKSKASIIGLPKTQKTTYVDSRARRHCRPPASGRLFLKRSERSGKSGVPVTEPSSPKVSCIGRVRSKRDKNRHLRIRRRSSNQPSSTPTTAPATETEYTTKATKTTNSQRKTGLWANLKAIFRSGCRHSHAVAIERASLESPSRTSVASFESRFVASEPSCEPTGLGALKRFASGRKSESWCGSEVDDGEVERGQSDREVSVWRRRAVGPLKEVDCVRDLECVGPITV